jgi:hypothetical protein
MVLKSSIIIAALAACAAATVGMGSAAAATQVPFTITETNIQFFDEYDTGDFTTTTGPLCPSGTFIDTYRALAGLAGQHFQHPLENVTADAVYTCADGSGSFHILKRVRLVATPPGIDNTGPVSFVGERAPISASPATASITESTGWAISPATSCSPDRIGTPPRLRVAPAAG